MNWLRRTIAMALALFAFGCCVAHVAGCKPPLVEPEVVEARAKNAVDWVAYERELVECRALGRDAGTFVAYELCASTVDRKYGVKP